MTQTHSRPAGNGAASEVGETTSSVPRAWHEQAEWECAHQYAEGWAAGYAAGQLAIADEVAAAIGVAPYDRLAVIRDLIRGIGQVTT